MNIQLSTDLVIPDKKVEQIINDPAATAKAIKLVYVNDRQEGIRRVKAGKQFKYLYQQKAVKDKSTLDRIKSLVLPPAWENVWICAKENGHLQATGMDALGRKQYRYHPLWNEMRNQTKFYRMLEFGKSLPKIRKQVKKDMSKPGMSREKVLATIVALMERTCIRIGNEMYEKLYGSVGLTTMKNKHVKVRAGVLKFSFVGKKGKEHLISIKSKKLAHIVKQCLDIPGKELFQYYDPDGNKQSIDSGMVNEYISNIVSGDYTAKDFRTWAGTVQCLLALKETRNFTNTTEAKKNITEVLDKVAAHLGNTRTVCRKYYVHPSLLDLYEKEKLQDILQKNTVIQNGTGSDLAPEEKLLLGILKKL